MLREQIVRRVRHVRCPVVNEASVEESLGRGLRGTEPRIGSGPPRRRHFALPNGSQLPLNVLRRFGKSPVRRSGNDRVAHFRFGEFKFRTHVGEVLQKNV
jgi:hypothetical protein